MLLLFSCSLCVTDHAMNDYSKYENGSFSMPNRKGITKQHIPQEGRRPHQFDTSAAESLYQDSTSSQYELPERIHRTPVKAVPQSSEKVISALKDLQDKIKRMELERTAAEKRLNTLATETTHQREYLDRPRGTHQLETTDELSRRTQELQRQLREAESRCTVVEGQLSQMRGLVQRAERDREGAIRVQRDAHSTEYSVQSKEAELRLQRDRLNELETERQRLKMTQSAAERKIRDLEERVLVEQHQKKLIQDKAAELQTVAETNRILLQAERDTTPPMRQPKRKRRKKKVEVAPERASPGHLHVKVGRIPFVAGQSTTPSHSINANMQNVLALMKTHNPAWCANGVNSPHRVGPPQKRKKGKPRRIPPTGSADGDLSDLLQCLQDEFGIMSCEHRELARQIQEVEDSNLRDGLEGELDQLVARMEQKSQQIAKLKRHQQQISEKRTSKKSPSRPSSGKSKGSSAKKQTGAEVQVITTVRTRGRGVGPVRVTSGTNRERGVQMLRDMQTLQTSLRKDDLSWE